MQVIAMTRNSMLVCAHYLDSIYILQSPYSTAGCYSLFCVGCPRNVIFTGILLLLLTQYWFHWNPTASTATPYPILVSLESYCYSLPNTGFTGILLLLLTQYWFHWNTIDLCPIPFIGTCSIPLHWNHTTPGNTWFRSDTDGVGGCTSKKS